MKEIVSKVWIYVALVLQWVLVRMDMCHRIIWLHLMGKSAWFSVPLSVLIGIPLYSNAAGIIPIVSVLIEKGASLGTSLAFMMAVIGLSLPEMIILKKVLKLPLILCIYWYSWHGDHAGGLFIQFYFLKVQFILIQKLKNHENNWFYWWWTHYKDPFARL